MPLDENFIEVARRHFNPFCLASGTELMSPLLYSLARMVRPQTVVEYGSGYSTLFILRALADNMHDVALEKDELFKKTRNSGILDCANPDHWDRSSEAISQAGQWLEAGDVACDVDPSFYLQRYSPHLFSFESLPKEHAYVENMRSAVSMLGFQSLFTQVCGQRFRKDSLPPDVLPVDLAWNDYDQFPEFFSEFWDCLNPSGGLMVFHNVPGIPEAYEPVKRMIEQRASHGDLECLVLEEPHKLCQNGCAILRRTTNYRPRFSVNWRSDGQVILTRPAETLQALRTLLSL